MGAGVSECAGMGRLNDDKMILIELKDKRKKKMSNILKAMKLIIDMPITEIKRSYSGSNRANSVGDALEYYVQDIFADSFGLDEEAKMLQHNKTFSLLGNQNNPPDLILRNGDAIEIKKVESPNNVLALNSSYPKSKLFVDSPMITQACRTCEDWSVKDIIYIVGHTTDTKLKYLWLVYGDCFAADKETYERIKNTITSGVADIQGVEFTATKELGKVKKVDPLGITDLRIRGMWHIENPNTLFSYFSEFDKHADFQVFCLMRRDKFNSFPAEDKACLLEMSKENYLITEQKIKNPNNPADLLDCIFISYKEYL